MQEQSPEPNKAIILTNTRPKLPAWQQVLFATLISLAGCTICSLLWSFYIYTRFERAFRPPAEFCTPQDELYQVIKSHGDEWIDAFRSRKDYLTSGSIVIEMPNGSNHSVIVMGSDPPLLLIPVTIFRDILQGYLYTPFPDDRLLDYAPDVKYMGDGIYCFDDTGWFSFEENQ